MKPKPKKVDVELGSWVELPDSGDIGGVVTEYTQYRDGSERWSVAYWHNGEKRHVQVERREMRLADRKR